MYKSTIVNKKRFFDSSVRSESVVLLLMCKKVLTVITLLFFFTGCSNDNTEEFNESLGKKLESSLQKSIEEHNVTGAVLAVRSDNGSSWKGSAGYSILENETEMSTDLSFRIGSITKTFTATLILILIDEGLLSLETTLNEVVPELEIIMGDQITIENLLEMRSGLEKYLANEDFGGFYIYDPGRIWTPEELVYYTNNKVSEPNSTFLYNNGNFIILGLIVEKLTGMEYESAANKYIFKPLNMENTYLPSDLNVPEYFAYGYEYDATSDLNINITYNFHPSLAWSAGGMISNADDLLIWANAYTEGLLISDELHQKQFTLQTAENNIGIDSYGFGAMKYGNLIGHDGFIPPYGSWVATYKNYKFVFLLNGTGDVAIPALVASYVLNDIIDAVDDEL